MPSAVPICQQQDTRCAEKETEFGAEGLKKGGGPRAPAFAGSLHLGPRASDARWGEFGGSDADEVEFRAEGSEEGGKSPLNIGPLCA
jgi:hypothetical protein